MNPGQLSRNILSSWAGYAARFGINLLFIPFITATLGQDLYGIWVLCFQIIGYFSLLELGLDRALLRFIPKALGMRDMVGANRILNTAAVVYLVSGIIVIVASQLLAGPILSLFKTALPSLTAEGVTALKVIGVYLGIRFWLTPFGGNLSSFQRADLANLLQGIEDIVRTALMVWVLLNDGTLWELALVITATTSARLIVGSIILKRLHSEIRFDPRSASRDTSVSLMRYGGTSLAITLATLLIFNSEGPILAIMLGTAATGLYAPAAQLMLYMRHMVNTIGTPLTAALSQLDAEGNSERVHLTYLSSLRLASILSFLVGSGVLILAPDFVNLWLRPEFAATGQIMQILAVGAVFFVPQIIGNAVLFGLERHRYLLLVFSIEAIAKVLLAVWLTDKFGLVGMAWAGVIPQVILYTTLYPWLISRVLSLSVWKILSTSLLPGIRVAVITLPAAYFARELIEPTSWFSFGFVVAVVTLTSAIPAYYSLTTVEKKKIASYFAKK